MKTFLFAAMMAVSTGAVAAEYEVDASHSKVGFSVRHLVSKVSGDFKDYKASFDFDPATKALSGAKITVEAKSIDTDNAKRDEHLRSADFFDVTKFPTLAATSGKITKKSDTQFEWATDLTLHGVTKPVTFDVEYLGASKDPWGGERAGFSAKAKINRKDFGLGWNKVLETGGVLVGDEVEIVLDVEAVKATAKSAKN